MVLNDCFDLAEDRRERPGRPLPSGRIPVPLAWGIGLGLLLAGLLLGLIGGTAMALLTLLLSGAVLLYDGLLKHGPLGPPAMGACRWLNWLVGFAVSPQLVLGALLAMPVFLYTTAVTLLSGIETRGGQRGYVLATAALLGSAGSGVILLYAAGMLSHPAGLPGLALLLVLLGARLRDVYLDPSPANVQAGVRWLLLGMIPLDAILLAGDGQWLAALGLLVLLLPGRVLPRNLYVT
jgi:4-hydroxybenzoate polyprenyltransferase